MKIIKQKALKNLIINKNLYPSLEFKIKMKINNHKLKI